MRLPPWLLAAALVLGASSCVPSASERDRLGVEAARAQAAARWEEAARALEARIALAPARPRDPSAAGALDRLVRVDFYNLACARARLGRHEPAFDALEQALRDGAGDIGFDHLVRDPDLVPLRGKARWDALVRHLSWNEEVGVSGTGRPGEEEMKVVVWISPDVNEIEEEVFCPRGVTHAYPKPPYLLAPGVRTWRTTLEAGARAAEKAVFSVGAAERMMRGRAGPRILAARGAEHVRIAWEVLLREPKAFTHAVLDGPSPPAWILLDRGADRIASKVIAVGPAAMPPPGLGVEAEEAGTLEEAFRRAVR